MPTDYRRFTGPEDSVSYKIYTEDYLKEDKLEQLLNKEGKRKDGRQLLEGRSMFARTDMVSQAKGSSYLEQQKTKVVCSVFDPREIPHQNEFSQMGEIFCEVKFAPFSCPRKRRPHAPDAEEKALSVAVRQALEPTVCRHMFPNYQIDVFIYILENDGSCLSAAINAAGLALADAAVPMYDIITSCSAAIVDNMTFVDPTEIEEHSAMTSTKGTPHGVITISMLPALKQIANLTQVGSMDTDCINQTIDILEKECLNIVPYIQTVLVKSVVANMEDKIEMDEIAKARRELLNKKVEDWRKLL